MEVTEVVEDAMTGCHGGRDMEVTEVVEDAIDRVSWWERHGGDRGCGGCNGQGVMMGETWR